MDENQADIDLLTTMGDSIAIDYGVSILKTSNCSAQFKNGCSPREKLHFRFWPGKIFKIFFNLFFKNVVNCVVLDCL